MKTVFPDYEHSIVNLTCSFLNYFGEQADHPTLPEMDRILDEQKPDHIVLLLLDGLGANILRRALPEDSFLRSHLLSDISSVFPPTTVAATTSVITGKTPAETGWIGWETWFPEIGESVVTYLNNIKDSKEQASDQNLAETYMPYRSITDLFADRDDVKAHLVSPYGDIPYKKVSQIPQKIADLCKIEKRNFLYTYVTEPDEKQHLFGTGSPEALEKIKALDRMAENLFDLLPKNSLLCVIADHGHLNSVTLTLEDYPELFAMLSHDVSVEPRATSLFVKPECLLDFRIRFEKTFGEEFLLYGKEEFLGKGFLGPGKEHPRLREMLGDYIAIAVSDKCLQYRKGSHEMKSNHAGLTEDEMIVPLLVSWK